MKPASKTDREEFPKVQQHIGEDPARFLDRSLIAPSDIGGSPFLIAKARIDGIDRLSVITAWIAVEKKLDRGPRDKVISLLEDRKRYLEEHGERPDEFDIDRDVESTDSVAVWPNRDGGERTVLKVRNGQAVATDGGEDSGD
jgi:hypothetical protein